MRSALYTNHSGNSLFRSVWSAQSHRSRITLFEPLWGNSLHVGWSKLNAWVYFPLTLKLE